GLAGAARRYRRAILRRVAHRNHLDPAAWERHLVRAGFRVTGCHHYLPAAAVACWELLSDLTGGLAVLLAGGRRTPREVQRALRVDALRAPVLAGLTFAACAPFWLPLLLTGATRDGGAVLITAVKVR